MSGRRHSIKSFYRLSLIEGEGVGTAYEYYAKAARLRRFLSIVGKPKSILVAGLPERYGLSMDFFLLAEEVHADVLVIDEREDRMQKAKQVMADLVSKGVLSGPRTRFITVQNLGELNEDELCSETFDLALSCEVLQRLDSSRDRYVSQLWARSRNIAVFVPNRGNAAHSEHSGLSGLCVEELMRVCRQERRDACIYDFGFLDMPPFPPGVSRSQNKREKAAQSLLEGLLMKALEGYCSLERYWPISMKAKYAHIAYVMACHENVRR
jgi:hypothetical protein